MGAGKDVRQDTVPKMGAASSLRAHGRRG